MQGPLRWGRIVLRPTHLIADIIIIVISVFLAVYLRVGEEGLSQFLPVIYRYLPLIVLIRVGSLIGFGCYRIIWRYVSAQDAVRLAQSVAVSTALIIILSFFMAETWWRLPRSVYFIDGALVGILFLGSRLLIRMKVEEQQRRQAKSGIRTLIYGAGVNGKIIAERFRSDAGLNVHIVGFLDDDPQKQGLTLSGVRVLGTRAQFAELIPDLEIQHLVVAIPSLSAEALRDLVTNCTKHGIRPMMASRFGTQETTSWKEHQVIRAVNLHDLLNRPPRDLDLQALKQLVSGKRVLVTGAGGSIGSELSRQVAAHGPSKLVLLDHSEYNLFEIDKELRGATASTAKITPVLLDLKDQPQVDRIVDQIKPEILIHAAAYKHVHLAEENPAEVIRNNVTGTANLLGACDRNGVEVFLLISTDKAVNPLGVMGATKRVCELMTTAVGLETGRRYCSVRFGNVLGSSGSLIPILENQIRQGGPLTITHPEMSRYFMLIPEAVSLVLKACTIAKPGDINVLKMGEPVKIVDIARNMIALSGNTEEEIPIVFTSPRPGEKLSEELYLSGDELQTGHPDILTLPMGNRGQTDIHVSTKTLMDSVQVLCALAERNDPRSRAALFELITNQTQSAKSMMATGSQA